MKSYCIWYEVENVLTDFFSTKTTLEKIERNTVPSNVNLFYQPNANIFAVKLF